MNDSVKWLWNWAGKCIGYSLDNYFRDCEGNAIGRFVNNEIYSENGDYLGEIYAGNGRLCVDKTKTERKIEPFGKPDNYYKLEKREDASSMKIYNQFADYTI